jgi:hypothetical protein
MSDASVVESRDSYMSCTLGRAGALANADVAEPLIFCGAVSSSSKSNTLSVY